MRITTRAVYQMTEDGLVELERESYEYDGPVAEAKGGGNTTTVQQADPWAGIQPYLLGAFSNLSDAAGTPQYYPGQTYADFDPAQQAGMQGMLGYSQSPFLNQLIGNQGNAVNWGMTGATDPNQNMALGAAGNLMNQFSNYGNNPAYAAAFGDMSRYSNPMADPSVQNAMGVANQANQMVADPMSNPTLAPWLESALRPVTQQYQEQVLPGIRDQAEMFGGAGSRTGLAEGVAARGYMDTVGDISSSMYNNAFNQGLNQQINAGNMLTGAYGQGAGLNLNATGQMGNMYGQMAGLQSGATGMFGQNYGQGMDMMTRSLAMAPQVQQSGMLPWQIQQQVGGQYQAQQQNAINDAMARFNFDQNAPFERATQYVNTLQGTPWGSSSTTGPNPNASNPMANAMGGAMMGAAMPGMFGAYASAAGPTAAPMLMGMGPMGWAALAGLSAFALS